MTNPLHVCFPLSIGIRNKTEQDSEANRFAEFANIQPSGKD